MRSPYLPFLFKVDPFIDFFFWVSQRNEARIDPDYVPNATEASLYQLDTKSEQWRRWLRQVLFLQAHSGYREAEMLLLQDPKQEIERWLEQTVSSQKRFIENCRNLLATAEIDRLSKQDFPSILLDLLMTNTDCNESEHFFGVIGLAPELISFSEFDRRLADLSSDKSLQSFRKRQRKLIQEEVEQEVQRRKRTASLMSKLFDPSEISSLSLLDTENVDLFLTLWNGDAGASSLVSALWDEYSQFYMDRRLAEIHSMVQGLTSETIMNKLVATYNSKSRRWREVSVFCTLSSDLIANDDVDAILLLFDSNSSICEDSLAKMLIDRYDKITGTRESVTSVALQILKRVFEKSDKQ